MDGNTLKDLAMKLLGVASIFDPKNAMILKLLVEVAGDFNTVMAEIRNQTEANAPEVWTKVAANFTSAAEDFEAAVEKNS